MLFSEVTVVAGFCFFFGDIPPAGFSISFLLFFSLSDMMNDIREKEENKNTNYLLRLFIHPSIQTHVCVTMDNENLV